MSFITQGANNSCGAFCICYLKWLEEGRQPNQENPVEHGFQDYPFAADLYRYVQFGDSVPPGVSPEDLPEDYCDPVRMFTMLKLTHLHTSFYIQSTSSMAAIFAAMQGPNSRNKAFLDALAAAGSLFPNTEPPVPHVNAEASIAVYDVRDSAEFLIGQHYILFRQSGGFLYRYNPSDGIETPCTGYDDFTFTEFGQTFSLSFANAALLISP